MAHNEDAVNTSSFPVGFPRSTEPCEQLTPRWRQSSQGYTTEQKESFISPQVCNKQMV